MSYKMPDGDQPVLCALAMRLEEKMEESKGWRLRTGFRDEEGSCSVSGEDGGSHVEYDRKN